MRLKTPKVFKLIYCNNCVLLVNYFKLAQTITNYLFIIFTNYFNKITLTPTFEQVIGNIFIFLIATQKESYKLDASVNLCICLWHRIS